MEPNPRIEAVTDAAPGAGGGGPASVLVTGAAGFIGSTLVPRLLGSGHTVIAVDHGTDPRHHRARAANPGAHWRSIDLATAEPAELLDGVELVVHLAGRPGVQTSWGQGFADHLAANAAMSQRLFEAALDTGIRRIVVASSSSVYGNVADGWATEDRPAAPLSPYGVSKATLEQLIGVYAARGLPVIGLRYFSVYGRRQRADMALHRMIEAARGGSPFPLRGSGRRQRDLTHVDDAVGATVSALFAAVEPGRLINVGSGRPVTLGRMADVVGDLLGRPVPMVAAPEGPGDPGRTAADVTLAGRLLHWSPSVPLVDGIADQIAHHRSDDDSNRDPTTESNPECSPETIAGTEPAPRPIPAVASGGTESRP